MTASDQKDLLMEQVKMLAGEIAFSTSTLKRLIEHSADDPDASQAQVWVATSDVLVCSRGVFLIVHTRVNLRQSLQIQSLEHEIQEKQKQMSDLELQIAGISETAADNASLLDLQHVNVQLFPFIFIFKLSGSPISIFFFGVVQFLWIFPFWMSYPFSVNQKVMKLMTQCSEKGFELEVINRFKQFFPMNACWKWYQSLIKIAIRWQLRTADNRILQDQLQEKVASGTPLPLPLSCSFHLLSSSSSPARHSAVLWEQRTARKGAPLGTAAGFNQGWQIVARHWRLFRDRRAQEAPCLPGD